MPKTTKSYLITHRPKKGENKYWGVYLDGISRLDTAQKHAKIIAEKNPNHRIEIWCDTITVEKIERIQ